MKNTICHLLFSSGTPMILGGDEFMRTQRGNNNAYCQDNEISWFHWTMGRGIRRSLISLRRRLPLKKISDSSEEEILSRQGSGCGSYPDITWFGKDLGRPNWDDPELRTLCYQLDGGKKNRNWVITISSYSQCGLHLQFIWLPGLGDGKKWYRVIDTSLKEETIFLTRAGKSLSTLPIVTSPIQGVQWYSFENEKQGTL